MYCVSSSVCLRIASSDGKHPSLQFSGLAEAGFYPGLQYMIGSWYRKDEMAKRACILNASGSIAMLFSGFLMTGVTNLSGRGGLPGWKWLVLS